MIPKPFMLQLARRDDLDRWSVGWDCGEIVFRRDFEVYAGSVHLEAAKNMAIASKAMAHHFGLAPEEQRRIVEGLDRMYAHE